MVLTVVANPVALPVTVAVPVSDSAWMKNALDDELPAGIVSAMLASAGLTDHAE